MGIAAPEVGRRGVRVYSVEQGDSHSFAVEVEAGQLTSHSYYFSLVNENCKGSVCCTASTIACSPPEFLDLRLNIPNLLCAWLTKMEFSH